MPEANPAPSQPPISATTRLCAVLGHPIRHSASPAMQNAGLRELGFDWRYVAFDVPPERLATAIQGAATLGFIGLNLTVPHKLLALDLVDHLDDSARTWGAVNTIRFERQHPDGHWLPLRETQADAEGPVRAAGFNTDADAIVRSIQEDLGLELGPESSVLVLGAGGAGRVAALRLAHAGVGRLYLVNRTPEKAAALQLEMAQRYPRTTAEVGYPTGPIDLLINATSAGLKPADPLPLDPARFPLERARCVYDMIYRPAETPLLQRARAAGCRTSNGLGMLLHQGTRALEIWTGRPAPVAVMRTALHHSIHG